MTSILKVDELQDSSGNLIIKEVANAITIGASGDTVTIPAGATLSNLGTATGFNTPAFEAYSNSAQAGLTSNTNVKMAANTERFDTDGCYDNSSNYRFTPDVAGKYFVYATADIYSDSTPQAYFYTAGIYKNGSGYVFNVRNITSSGSDEQQSSTVVHSTIDMNGSSDYVEVFARIVSTSGTWSINANNSLFGAYRIGT